MSKTFFIFALMKKFNYYFFRSIVAVCLSLCCEGVCAQSEQWVGSWAAAAEFTGPSDMPAAPLTGRTLREIIQVSLGGECFRMRLSNEFSDEPVEIRGIYVADALDSCDIRKGTARFLTFAGKRSVTIPARQAIESDICRYALQPLQRLSITIQYGATPEHATSHRGSRTTSFLAPGAVKPNARFVATERVDHWYNIAALEVPSKGQQCIAVLGNSITDGRGSTTNHQNRWPDMMAAALGGNVGVLNLGIGGNCVLQGGLSEPALKRFDRDILGQNGVTTAIIFQGTNDIGGSRGNSEQVAQRLKEAYKGFVEQLHARGIKVYGATITPFKGNGWYSFYHEAARRDVNEWIRTSGVFDGIIDFDALIRDEADSERIRAEWHEDGLHPNATGYKVMGEYAAKCLQSYLGK